MNSFVAVLFQCPAVSPVADPIGGGIVKKTYGLDESPLKVLIKSYAPSTYLYSFQMSTAASFVPSIMTTALGFVVMASLNWLESL